MHPLNNHLALIHLQAPVNQDHLFEFPHDANDLYYSVYIPVSPDTTMNLTPWLKVCTELTEKGVTNISSGQIKNITTLAFYILID